MSPPGFIPPHGGYEKLLSYQKARVVYDGTVRFCERHFPKRDRTREQMTQAGSGKQNIIEGSRASGTSKESEIKLTNVARDSFEELLEDFRDFIRLRAFPNGRAIIAHTPVARAEPPARHRLRDFPKRRIENPDPAISANVMIGLIKLTNYLLDQQLRQLEKAFLQEGGLREA